MEKEFMNLLFMVKTLVLALYGGMPLEEKQAEEILKELDKIDDRMNELSDGNNADLKNGKLPIPHVSNLICPNCGGSPVEKMDITMHCTYCDHWW
jgi:hypothetical protein